MGGGVGGALLRPGPGPDPRDRPHRLGTRHGRPRAVTARRAPSPGGMRWAADRAPRPTRRAAAAAGVPRQGAVARTPRPEGSRVVAGPELNPGRQKDRPRSPAAASPGPPPEPPWPRRRRLLARTSPPLGPSPSPVAATPPPAEAGSARAWRAPGAAAAGRLGAGPARALPAPATSRSACLAAARHPTGLRRAAAAAVASQTTLSKVPARPGRGMARMGRWRPSPWTWAGCGGTARLPQGSGRGGRKQRAVGDGPLSLWRWWLRARGRRLLAGLEIGIDSEKWLRQPHRRGGAATPDPPTVNLPRWKLLDAVLLRPGAEAPPPRQRSWGPSRRASLCSALGARFLSCAAWQAVRHSIQNYRGVRAYHHTCC
jgi:hypothetical protein